jgi:hypothetical protein
MRLTLSYIYIAQQYVNMHKSYIYSVSQNNPLSVNYSGTLEVILSKTPPPRVMLPQKSRIQLIPAFGTQITHSIVK